MSTEKPGPSMFPSERDASITTCGLLNNIMAGGWPPERWATMLIHALRVHQYGKRKALGLPATLPKWKGFANDRDKE